MNHPVTRNDLTKMRLAQIESTVRQCSFDPWRIKLGYKDGVPYVQIVNDDGVCNVTGKPLSWSGRKWMLSEFMCRSEVVRTVWKAVLAAVEHETAETFKFRGVPIYDPHVDVVLLADLIVNGGIETRPTQQNAV